MQARGQAYLIGCDAGACPLEDSDRVLPLMVLGRPAGGS